MGQQVLDTRELATGKDGRLFVEAGSVNMLMAEINTFSVNMDVKSVEKQPVGDILVHDVPTGVAYTLTFTEMVVRDDLIMEPLLAEIQQGRIPSFNLTKPLQKGVLACKTLLRVKLSNVNKVSHLMKCHALLHPLQALT